MPKVARPAADARGPRSAREAADETESEEPAVPAGPSRARRAAGWAFTPGRLLGVGLVPLCAAVSLWAARRLPDLGDRPEYALTPAAVRLDPPPPGPVPADLAARVLGDEPASILEDGLAARLAKGFKKHPWVRRVRGVRLSHPARADVELVYRKPAAAVAVRDGLYPVDAAGVVLPPADFTRAAAEALPRIEGAFAAPGPAGAAWSDEAAVGAAAVCAELAGVWAECDLAAVRPLPRRGEAAAGTRGHEPILSKEHDSREHDPRDGPDPHYELVTRSGSRVTWGRAPGSGHPGELTAAEKRRRLTGEVRRLLTDAAPDGPRRVDLTKWDGIWHEPLPVRVGVRDDEFGGIPR